MYPGRKAQTKSKIQLLVISWVPFSPGSLRRSSFQQSALHVSVSLPATSTFNLFSLNQRKWDNSYIFKVQKYSLCQQESKCFPMNYFIKKHERGYFSQRLQVTVPVLLVTGSHAERTACHDVPLEACPWTWSQGRLSPYDCEMSV